MKSKTKQKYDIYTAKRTLKAHQNRLLKLKNVEFLTIGFKRVENQKLSRFSICCYVSKKQDVEPTNKIPKRLRAIDKNGKLLSYYIPTDVQEIGEPIKALGLAGGNRLQRWTKGCAGIIYRSVSGKDLLLTNAHVVASIEDFPHGADVFALKQGNTVSIGSVYRMIRLRKRVINQYDAALIKLSSSIDVDHLRILGRPEPLIGYGQFSSNDNHIFFYVCGNDVVHCHSPEKVQSSLAIPYTRDKVKVVFRGFWRLGIVGSTSPKPGHSGSVLLRKGSVNGRNGLLICGLLFAGSNKIVLVHSVKPLLKALSNKKASIFSQSENVFIKT